MGVAISLWSRFSAVCTIVFLFVLTLPSWGGELESLDFHATDSVLIAANWNHSVATPSSRILIVAPGFAQHQGTQLMKDLSQTLSQFGDVLIFDFRGTGKSGGWFWWGSHEYRDLDQILSWARIRYHDVVLMGFSLGSYAAVRAAYLWPERIDQLFLISVPTRVDDIVWKGGVVHNAWDMVTNWTELSHQEPGNWVFHWGPPFAAKPDISTETSDIKLPAHFLVGGHDHLINEAMTLKVYKPYAGPKDIEVIPNGNHAEAMTEENKAQFSDWVSRGLKTAN